MSNTRLHLDAYFLIVHILSKNAGAGKVIMHQYKNDLLFWRYFVYLADYHKLMPAISFIISEKFEEFPDDLLLFFEQIKGMAQKRNEGLFKQVSFVNTSLREQGIRPVFFKGVGNAFDNLYESQHQRLMSDIDVWVEQKDFLLAVNVLKSLGYKQAKYFNPAALPVIKHFPILFHSNYAQGVEIHCRLTDFQYDDLLANHSLLRCIKDMRVKNWNTLNQTMLFSVFTDDLKLMINFVHSQLAGFGRYHHYPKGKDMMDAFLLIQRGAYKNPLFAGKYKQEYDDYIQWIQFVFSSNYPIESLSYENLRFKLYINRLFRKRLSPSGIYFLKVFYFKYVRTLLLSFINKKAFYFVNSKIGCWQWYKYRWFRNNS